MARELPTQAGDFLVIGCKLPQGLHIHVAPHPEPIKLNGTHSPYARNGVGLTNVPADAWNKIKEQYKDAPWLRRGFVYAQATAAKAKDAAKELKGERNGFEAIDPKNPNALPGISVTIQKEGEKDPGEG